MGRLSQTSISADTSYQIDYAYNSLGALDTLTYPTSTSGYRLKVKYEYQYGQHHKIRECTNGACSTFGTTYWTAGGVNGRNQITQESLGNGLQTNRVFDAVTGWIKTIQTGSGGGTGIQNLAYTWDLVGNLASRIDHNQSSLTESFFYDNLYRLDYSQLNGVTNLDLAYDALGNITSKSDVGTYTYHASKKHQLTSTSNGWSFAHDANGNMTSGRGATVTWTSYNYPATIANGTDTAAFTYTPDRQYWKQVSNYTSGGAATTIYVAGILEKVTAGGFTDFRHMIRAGGSKIIVSRSTSGTNSVHYVTSDHLGSNSAVTNSSGSMLVNSSFDAFGKRRGSNWSGNPSASDWTAIAGTTRRGYTDHTMLDNLNLIQMNGRVQDPMLGRFVSADPFITEPGFTQNYNRYSYVYNNPLRHTDPSGFAGEEDFDLAPGIYCYSPSGVTGIGTYACGAALGFAFQNGEAEDRQNARNHVAYQVDGVWVLAGHDFRSNSTLSSDSIEAWSGIKGHKAKRPTFLQQMGCDFGIGSCAPERLAYGEVYDGRVCAGIYGCFLGVDETYGEFPEQPLGTLDWEMLGAGLVVRSAIVAGQATSVGGTTEAARGAVVSAEGTANAAQGARLAEHLRQLEKYGSAGYKELANGRFRYYGQMEPARNAGEMAGRRLVREWDPATGSTRTWHETLDSAGRVRIVRPETGGPRIHYEYDAEGNYVGSW